MHYFIVSAKSGDTTITLLLSGIKYLYINRAVIVSMLFLLCGHFIPV